MSRSLNDMFRRSLFTPVLNVVLLDHRDLSVFVVDGRSTADPQAILAYQSRYDVHWRSDVKLLEALLSEAVVGGRIDRRHEFVVVLSGAYGDFLMTARPDELSEKGLPEYLAWVFEKQLFIPADSDSHFTWRFPRGSNQIFAGRIDRNLANMVITAARTSLGRLDGLYLLPQLYPEILEEVITTGSEVRLLPGFSSWTMVNAHQHGCVFVSEFYTGYHQRIKGLQTHLDFWRLNSGGEWTISCPGLEGWSRGGWTEIEADECYEQLVGKCHVNQALAAYRQFHG